MMNGEKTGGRRGKHGACYMCAFRFVWCVWAQTLGLKPTKAAESSRNEMFGLFAVQVNKSKAATCALSVFICSSALIQKSTRSNNIRTHSAILAGSFRLLSGVQIDEGNYHNPAFLPVLTQKTHSKKKKSHMPHQHLFLNAADIKYFERSVKVRPLDRRFLQNAT